MSLRARRRIGIGAFALLLSAGLWVSCGDDADDARTAPPADLSALAAPGVAKGFDVVVVTLDTTRFDALGLNGATPSPTPNIDALARNALVFTQAAAAAPITLPAHASLFTGLYPPRHGVRNNGTFRLDDAQLTLAEHLAGAGYDCGAAIASYVVASRFGLAQGFDHYDESLPRSAAGGELQSNERDARAVTDAALRWLRDRREGAAGDEKPFFLWLHYFDPHLPYRPPARFASPRSDERARYHGEIRHADEEFGRVVDWLSEAGRLDRTLFVITADHGEALQEHGEATHGIFVYDATIRVPLVFAGSVFEGRHRIDDLAVSHVDVFPTLASMLGVDVPEGLDGRDLLRETVPTDRGVYAEAMLPFYNHGWSSLCAWRTRDGKYIRAPEPELYDLRTDPGETSNLLPKAADRAGEFESRLADVSGEAPRAEDEGALDDELAARLAALGYTRGVSGSASGDLEDPKRMLPLYRRAHEALAVAKRGDPERGRDLIRRVLRGDPGNAKAWEFAAMINLQLGATDEAELCLQRSLELQETPNLRLMHGQVLLKLRRWDEGDRELARALELEPRLAEVHIARGDALAVRGRLEESLPHYRRALAEDPEVAGRRAQVKIAAVEEALKERRGR